MTRPRGYPGASRGPRGVAPPGSHSGESPPRAGVAGGRSPGPALISCLCLADAPLPAVKGAIRCFTEQTFEHRELLIGVVPGSWRAAALGRYASEAGLAGVRIVPALTLAALARGARGDLVCVWSANASCHPERLAIQAAELTAAGRRSCVVADVLRCVADDRCLYWLGGTPPGTPSAAAVAATLLARAADFGPSADALAAGQWPEGDLAPVRIPGTGLIVELTEGQCPAPPYLGTPGLATPYLAAAGSATPQAAECLALDAARPRLGQLRGALAAHRLPRPLLLHLRAADGTFAVLDPWEGEAA